MSLESLRNRQAELQRQHETALMGQNFIAGQLTEINRLVNEEMDRLRAEDAARKEEIRADMEELKRRAEANENAEVQPVAETIPTEEPQPNAA